MKTPEVQVIFRHHVEPGTEEAFMAAWERCKAQLLERAGGALGASLLRDAIHKSEFVTMTRWRSLADWRRYWRHGVPDPEGELPMNEVLVEVTAIGPSAPSVAIEKESSIARAPHRRPRSKSKTP